MEHGGRFEAHPAPQPRGARRWAGTFHPGTTDCLRDRYAAQETDDGRAEHRPRPLKMEEASTGRRRCPGRDPTCPCRPTATHAPFRSQCPSTHAPDRSPQCPWASRGSTKRMCVRTAPTGAETNRNNGQPSTPTSTHAGRASNRPTTGPPRHPSISPSQPTRLATRAQRPRGHRGCTARHVGRSGSSPKHLNGPSPKSRQPDPTVVQGCDRAPVPTNRHNRSDRIRRGRGEIPTETDKPTCSNIPTSRRTGRTANTPRRTHPTPSRARGTHNSARRQLVLEPPPNAPAERPTALPRTHAGRAGNRPTTGPTRHPNISPSYALRLATHAQRPRGHRERAARHVARSGSSPEHLAGPSQESRQPDATVARGCGRAPRGRPAPCPSRSTRRPNTPPRAPFPPIIGLGKKKI